MVHTPHFHVKVRGEVGTPWYTHAGLPSTGQRRGGRQWYRHTDVTPPLWSPFLLGMIKKLTMWSDWQLNLCRPKSTNDSRGK